MHALKTYETPILAEWTDYNGHLRDAFYLLLFSYATDALMDHLGLDAANRAVTNNSLFTLEVHLNYLHEVKEGESVEVRTQLIAHDHKRLHVFHSLHRAGEDLALAASEQMLLHVNLEGGARSAAFEGVVLEHVLALAEAHRSVPRPDYVGRTIGLPG